MLFNIMRRSKINVSSDCLRKYLATNLSFALGVSHREEGEISNPTESYANPETLTTQAILG